MKKLFILAITAVGLLACTGKNNPKNPSDLTTISCYPTTKTIDAVGGKFTVTITSNAAWSATSDKPWVTITPNSGQGDIFVTVTVESGGGDEAHVLFKNGNSFATLIIYRKTPEVRFVGGLLPGKFSVSPTKQIQFSQGNLQYQASTQSWRFAEKQYDIIGSDNCNISNNYSGWIDLFGWGTGNNPTNISMDRDRYDYYSSYVDWGTNAISNGGKEARLWRTLTVNEWMYLFCNRANAACLFGLGSVNGISGTIILPDNWNTPQGVSFTPSTTQGLVNQGGGYNDENGVHFSDNAYTAEQWSMMEQEGAVFVPAAGQRAGTGVFAAGSWGNYWSSSSIGTLSAYYLEFNSGSLNPQKGYYREYGRSVRLVR